MEDTSFMYFNCNPKAKHTTDCVIRAICTVTNKQWTDVFKELSEYTAKYGYMFNDAKNYGKYLKDFGWEKQPQPKK